MPRVRLFRIGCGLAQNDRAIHASLYLHIRMGVVPKSARLNNWKLEGKTCLGLYRRRIEERHTVLIAR